MIFGLDPRGPVSAVRHVLAIVVSLLAPHAAGAASIEVRHLDAAAALVVVDELAVGLLDPLLQPASAVITTATAMRGRRCL